MADGWGIIRREGMTDVGNAEICDAETSRKAAEEADEQGYDLDMMYQADGTMYQTIASHGLRWR